MYAEQLHESDGPEPASQFDAVAALRQFAIPRLTGSAGGAEATARIRALFEQLGYDVHDRPFRFCPYPGRFGLSLAGIVYTAGMIWATALIWWGNPVAAALIVVSLLIVIGAGAYFAQPLLDLLPFTCQEATNLVATVNGSTPAYIIVAHRDTKSQPMPLALRGPAIVIAILAWFVLLFTALAVTVQPVSALLVFTVGTVAAVSGLIVALGWVANRSPGALDNGSGVAAALGIAAREHRTGDVAFLITDAEELGLVGARAAARHLPAVHGAINLDGLDDHGEFHVMERYGVVRRRGLAPHLAAALLEEADELELPAERRDLPFGIPVDHIPISKAGTPAVTVMRGTRASLWRVHRGIDDLDHLRGDGIRKGVDLVCGALARLREQTRPIEH